MLLVLLLVLLRLTVQHALQKYLAQNQDPTSGLKTPENTSKKQLHCRDGYQNTKDE